MILSILTQHSNDSRLARHATAEFAASPLDALQQFALPQLNTN